MAISHTSGPMLAVAAAVKDVAMPLTTCKAAASASDTSLAAWSPREVFVILTRYFYTAVDLDTETKV